MPHIGSGGGDALDSATSAALRMGLVAPGGHVVCLERFSNSLGVHVVEAGSTAGGRGWVCAWCRLYLWVCVLRGLLNLWVLHQIG